MFARHACNLIALYAAIAAVTAAAQPIDAALADRAINTWSAAQKQIDTVDISWDANKVISGEFLEAGTFSRRDKRPDPQVFQQATHVILDHSSRIRIDTQSKQWSRKLKALVPLHTQFSYDGSKQTQLFLESAVEAPTAHLGPGSVADVANNQTTLAVRLIYRAFDPVIGVFSPADLSLAPEQPISEGVSLVALVRKTVPRKTIWLDPSKGMLPVRYMEFDRTTGSLKWELKLEYEEDGDAQWKPVKWSLSWLGRDKSVVQSEVANVTKCALNTRLEDAVFTVAVPPNTFVHDGFKKQRYILRESGVERPILRGEYTGDNFAELLATEPHQSLTKTSKSRWLIVMNIVLLIAISSAIIYRRVLRRKAV
jgi:hypothetical protein